MTTTAALQIVLHHHAIHDAVADTAQGCQINAATRETYSNIEDAQHAAELLLDRMLNLGYRLRDGLVGAERTSDGNWRGELLDLVLMPADHAAMYLAIA
jgi:hypothetical protein